MVEKKKQVDLREFNLDGYEVVALPRDRYKKLGKVEGLENLQYVQCSTDKQYGVIRYIPYDVKTSSDMDYLYSEARILLRMPHPNIIRIRDVFKSKGEIGMTYDKIVGDTIAQRMEKEPKLTEDEIIEIFVQICLAFQMIHENKVMHKNVRPEHFILEEGTNRVKVIGFSKLREMMNENSTSSLNEKVGKDKAYTPPECVGGQAYTRASDVWACGLILYQMASGGVFPYAITADAAEMTEWANKGSYKDPSVIGERSPKFQALLDGMFKPVPEERFSFDIIINKQLKEDVKKYLGSDGFRQGFKETRARMVLMNEKTQELFKVNCDETRSDKEYEAYCKKVFE